LLKDTENETNSVDIHSNVFKFITHPKHDFRFLPPYRGCIPFPKTIHLQVGLLYFRKVT